MLKKPWQRFQTAFTALEAWYRGVLHHILEHERKRVMAGAVALLVVSLFVLTQIGQEFTPTSDQSQFTLRVNAPRGESVTAAGRDLEAVRAALAEVPGVLHVYQRSDTQDANFFVQLVPKADRDRTQDEIVRDCRARVNALAGFQADVTIGYDKPVALSITGDDAAQLEAISHEVEGVLRTIPGVRDVTSSVRTGASELKIVRNDAMANELGVTPAAIGDDEPRHDLRHAAHRPRHWRRCRAPRPDGLRHHRRHRDLDPPDPRHRADSIYMDLPLFVIKNSKGGGISRRKAL